MIVRGIDFGAAKNPLIVAIWQIWHCVFCDFYDFYEILPFTNEKKRECSAIDVFWFWFKWDDTIVCDFFGKLIDFVNEGVFIHSSIFF